MMLKLVVVCCVLSTVFAKNSYVVVLPKIVRPGFQLNVGVNILKATSDVTVNAALVNKATSAVVASAVRNIAQGSPQTISIQVPRSLHSSKYEVQVTGNGGLVFKNSTSVQFNAKGTAVFIQTDKAMYKPGQTVNFRAFSVYPDLKPYKGPFTVEIYDPNSNKIKQWLNQRDVSSVVTLNFSLSDQPVLGDWKIKVSSDSHGEEKVFTVAEYVLPKFKVTVNLPSFGLTRDSSLAGSVEATYTYGKPVSGTAHIRIRDSHWYRPYKFTGQQPMVETNVKVIDGKGRFSFDSDIIAHVLDSPARAKTLIVEANVTDSLTSITLNGSSQIQYYTSGVKLEWLKSNPKNFKPGLDYIAYLKISKPDGSLLSGIKSDVSIQTIVTYNLPETTSTTPYPYYMPRTATYKLPRQNLTTPDNGLVAIPISIPDNATGLSVTAYYPDARASYLSLQKMYSPSNSYLQTFLRSDRLSAGQMAQFELKSTEPLPTVVYQILSRGVIVSTGTVNTKGQKTTQFSVPLTSAMAPNARILVYFVRADGEIVTDSISFNVDGLFANQVSINFDKAKGKPGESVNVVVSADANSVVNLLAVDQSVKLLKSGNDITESTVRDAMGLFDSIPQPYGPMIEPFFLGGMAAREKRMIWWPYPYFYGGNDAEDIFRNSGVLVMTDALVFHHDEPIYFYPEMAMGGMMPGAGGVTTAVSGGHLQEVTKVRKDFPETWLWTDTTVGTNGTAQISAVIPDTITSWIASAFAVNSLTGLGVSPTTAKLEAFKPFFVSLNLPYSVIRGEEVILQAIVFNYMTVDTEVLVTLAQSDKYRNIQVDIGGITQITSATQTETIQIKAGEAKSVYFPIIPAVIGNIDVIIRAQSQVAADAVQRQLLVEPEGVPHEYNIPVTVDLKDTHTFSKTIPINLPDGVVAGSKRARVTAIGDLLGPSIQNLDSLLQMPCGCGEQNMLNFAPDIFIMKYLSSTKNLAGDIKQKAIGFLEKGYQRELTYQHKDGSFSAFGDNDKSGSMWLTAFVVKSFNQAKPFIFIDEETIKRGINWILSHQNKDGSFPEPGRVIHKDMQGGSASGPALTSFVLIALMENKDMDSSLSGKLSSAAVSARTYLERQVSQMTNVYSLAITTYALTLAESTEAQTALNKLNAMAITADGMKHWEAPESTKTTTTHHWTPPNHAHARDVELTAYALLTYGQKNNINDGIQIMKWIVTQRNPRGGFVSTQDTVLALQALSEFAKLIYSSDFNVAVDIQAGETTRHFTINKDNAIFLQTLELPIVPSAVTVSGRGHGMALVEVSVYFNVEADLKEPSFEVQVQLLEETVNSLIVQTCTKSLVSKTGMSVQEIGIPSGFEANVDSIGDVTGLKRIETSNRKIILYFDEFTPTAVCLSMKVERTGLVTKTQPVPVRVYDYYSPDDQVTVFYQSQLLKRSSICEVCSDCGCPKK